MLNNSSLLCYSQTITIAIGMSAAPHSAPHQPAILVPGLRLGVRLSPGPCAPMYPMNFPAFPCHLSLLLWESSVKGHAG